MTFNIILNIPKRMRPMDMGQEHYLDEKILSEDEDDKNFKQ